MTQYSDRVQRQREILEQEKLDNQVTSLDIRYKNGNGLKWLLDMLMVKKLQNITTKEERIR